MYCTFANIYNIYIPPKVIASQDIHCTVLRVVLHEAFTLRYAVKILFIGLLSFLQYNLAIKDCYGIIIVSLLSLCDGCTRVLPALYFVLYSIGL